MHEKRRLARANRSCQSRLLFSLAFSASETPSTMKTSIPNGPWPNGRFQGARVLIKVWHRSESCRFDTRKRGDGVSACKKRRTIASAICSQRGKLTERSGTFCFFKTTSKIRALHWHCFHLLRRGAHPAELNIIRLALHYFLAMRTTPAAMTLLLVLVPALKRCNA